MGQVVVGSALASTASSSSDTTIGARTLVEEAGEKKQMFLNTCEHWWAKASDLTDCEDRTTCRGALFGRPARAPLDYIACDETFAQHVVKMYEISSPPDHDALETVFDLQQPAQVRNRTTPRKPIGWRPRCYDGYLASTNEYSQLRGPMTMTETSGGVQKIAVKQSAPPSKPMVGVCATEVRLRTILRSAGSSMADKPYSVGELWRVRDVILGEKRRSKRPRARTPSCWRLGWSSLEYALERHAISARELRTYKHRRNSAWDSSILCIPLRTPT